MGVPITFLSIGNNETKEAFFTQLLDTITYLAGVTNPPSTMTTSYSGNKIDFGSSLAMQVALHNDWCSFVNLHCRKICNGYMALSMCGISMVFLLVMYIPFPHSLAEN
jgi:hypothetical protein